MTNALIALAAFIALFLAAIALRHLWRAFIRATDREIEKEMSELRRKGFFGGDSHGRGRR